MCYQVVDNCRDQGCPPTPGPRSDNSDRIFPHDHFSNHEVSVIHDAVPFARTRTPYGVSYGSQTKTATADPFGRSRDQPLFSPDLPRLEENSASKESAFVRRRLDELSTGACVII